MLGERRREARIRDLTGTHRLGIANSHVDPRILAIRFEVLIAGHLLLHVEPRFAGSRQLTVNGRVEPQNGNWNSPLPPMRHNGYCIQTTPGNNSFAAFSAF